jgi:hypothetical protein
MFHAGRVPASSETDQRRVLLSFNNKNQTRRDRASIGASLWVCHVQSESIVEDHPVFREVLNMILSSQSDMAVVGQAATSPEAIAEFRLHKPT